jgi:hypothetical protein
METHDGGSEEKVSRPPLGADLRQLCAELNRFGARYVVVGGLAIIQHGFQRLTNDIDLLVETTIENEALVIQALLILPDKAARELKPGEIAQYGVVRVGDEILVGLMKSGCGVTYAEAIKDAVIANFDGVQIPFASAPTLWRMKQTVRAKDIPDRLFLRQLLGIPVETPADDPLSRLWRRFKTWWRGEPKAE